MKTILLVEDDSITAMAEAFVLKHEGYSVLHASSGREAIEKVEEKSAAIDLILMDIDLGPGIDGTEAAQIILKTHDIPVLFLSSHTEKEIVERTEQITCYGYVVKNSGNTVLLASIKMALRLHEANRREKALGTALAESENNYKALFTSTSDGVCVHEMTHRDESGFRDYKIIEVNPVFEEITKIPRDRAVGALASELYGAGSPPYLDLYSEVVKTGVSTSFDTFFEPLNTHFRISTFPVDGNKFATVFQDISTLKRAEEILLREKKNLHAIISSIPSGILVIDEKETVYYANPAAEILFESSLSDAKEGRCGDFLSCANRRKDPRGCGYAEDCAFCSLFAAIRRILEDPTGTEVGEGEALLVRDSGKKPLWLAYKARSLVFDGARRVVLALEDISEKKAIEDYRFLVEGQSDLVIKKDANGRILFVNDSYCRTFGKSKEELIGKGFRPSAHEEDKLLIKDALERLRKEPYSHSYEVRVAAVSGWRWIEWSSRAVLDETGDVRSFVGIGRDITERKEAEESLRRLNDQKEHLMKELQHRVKNNLGVVSSLLGLEMENLPDERSRQVFQNAQGRIRSMSAIYDQLHLSKDFEKINVSQYIRELSKAIFNTYVLDTSQVSLSIDSDELYLGSDRAVPLGLIINELITNSLKYAFPGKRRGFLHITLRNDEGRVSLLFKDDGVGMPPESERGGKGTGLLLVNVLTDQLRGTFSIARRQGFGAEVKIEFSVE